MGFFSKLFGDSKDKQPEVTENLPVQTAQLCGFVRLELTEILQPEHREELNMRIRQRREAETDTASRANPDDDTIVDSMVVSYEAELEYVVFDEKLRAEMIGGDDINESLNELFYVSLSEFNSVSVKVVEGEREEYAAELLEKFNYACRDWGVRGNRLTVKTIAPTAEYREFYEVYREIRA